MLCGSSTCKNGWCFHFIDMTQMFSNSSENNNRFCREWQVNKGLGATRVLTSVVRKRKEGSQIWREQHLTYLARWSLEELNERLLKQHDRFFDPLKDPPALLKQNRYKIFNTYEPLLTEWTVFDGEIVQWKQSFEIWRSTNLCVRESRHLRWF